MRMYKPPHPGTAFKEAFLDCIALNVTQAAQKLGITRKHLSNIIHAKAAVSPDVAKRFEALTGSSAEMWLNMQNAYDLWMLRDVTYEIERVA
jgi:addiction module HigA family antidote